MWLGGNAKIEYKHRTLYTDRWLIPGVMLTCSFRCTGYDLFQPACVLCFKYEVHTIDLMMTTPKMEQGARREDRTLSLPQANRLAHALFVYVRSRGCSSTGGPHQQPPPKRAWPTPPIFFGRSSGFRGAGRVVSIVSCGCSRAGCWHLGAERLICSLCWALGWAPALGPRTCSASSVYWCTGPGSHPNAAQTLAQGQYHGRMKVWPLDDLLDLFGLASLGETRRVDKALRSTVVCGESPNPRAQHAREYARSGSSAGWTQANRYLVCLPAGVHYHFLQRRCLS